MEVYLYLHLLLAYVPLKGAHGLSLFSSPFSDDGHLTVCPHKNVTLTCTATQINGISWRNQTRQIHVFVIRGDQTEDTRFVYPYTLTATIENHSGSRADFTSTLEVMVDNIDNGTNITCEIFQNQSHLVIHKADSPLPPYGLSIVTDDFKTDNFSILLSWTKSPGADNYTISVNTTTQPVITDMTTLRLEGHYNIPLEITLTATNCAGTSSKVISVVYEAGCSPPTPPVNGSVSEFTSSRVGAQVTYSCDTDLVLVGERVATCTEPSLQWLPTSEDIICVQPTVCSDPSDNLTSHASISSMNGSMVTFSCDPGYSLHGSATSQCVSGEWTPSPETVTCHAVHDVNTPLPSPVESYENCTNNSKTSVSLSTSAIVAITAVVCGLCSFTAGLVLGVLLTRYSVCCRRNKRVQTAGPVHEVDNILPVKGAGIELQKNEAYEYVSH